MTELMTYVRRGSRKANKGYAPLADAEALDDDAKENVSPLPVPGKKAASKARASSTEGGDRRSSWIGRMLSYSSSGVTTANDKSGKKNAKKKKSSSGAYSRKAMPTTVAEKKKKAFQQYLQDMKAYFTDVDAYELVVESPSPDAKSAVLSGNPLGDVSFSQRRSSQISGRRRSSIVIRRESISDYGQAAAMADRRLSSGVQTAARLSTRFDRAETLQTLAEEDEEDASDPCGSAMSRDQKDCDKLFADLDPISEAREDQGGSDDFVDTLDDIMDNLTIQGGAGGQFAARNSSCAADFGPGLLQLLEECGQLAESQAAIPTLDDFLCEKAGASEFSIGKVGEGTFGEAFKLNSNLVLKIVPIDGEVLVNGEKQKTSDELYAEVVIHNCLKGLREGGEGAARGVAPGDAAMAAANLCSTFIETHDISVCRGKYAPCLVDAWGAWDEINSSENDHPAIFQKDQLYIAFVYSDGGEDLESFKFRTFDEIRSMLMQVTMGLAVAEEELKFEHRDLHWGNILVKRTPRSALAPVSANSASAATLARREGNKVEFLLRGVPFEVDTSGLQVQIIDFTLSRLEAAEKGDERGTKDGGGRDGAREEEKAASFVAFCDLGLDEWLFKGPKNDIQAETYRKMRKCVADGTWAEFFPKNNVHWLQYLVDCVLQNKIRQASTRSEREDGWGARGEDGGALGLVDVLELTSDQTRELRHFRKACIKATCSHDLVWHDLFKNSWKVLRQ